MFSQIEQTKTKGQRKCSNQEEIAKAIAVALFLQDN